MNAESKEGLSKDETIEMLKGIIVQLQNEISVLRAENQELKRQLNQNSKNSSKPPSSDGYKKPVSLRKPTNRKSGGQLGHEGSGMKLPHKPDTYIRHEPASCAACPNVSRCIGSANVSETRYEIDIIAEAHVTAHQLIQVPCLLNGMLKDGAVHRAVQVNVLLWKLVRFK